MFKTELKKPWVFASPPIGLNLAQTNRYAVNRVPRVEIAFALA